MRAFGVGSLEFDGLGRRRYWLQACVNIIVPAYCPKQVGFASLLEDLRTKAWDSRAVNPWAPETQAPESRTLDSPPSSILRNLPSHFLIVLYAFLQLRKPSAEDILHQYRSIPVTPTKLLVLPWTKGRPPDASRPNEGCLQQRAGGQRRLCRGLLCWAQGSK